MDSPSLRYDRILITLTPVIIVANYALYRFFLAFWRPKLNSDGLRAAAGKNGSGQMTRKAWETFHKDSSGLVFGCFFHMWYGCAAYLAASSFYDDASHRTLGDRGALMAMGDVDFVRLQESAAFLGSVFAALMLDYLFYMALGWDRDPAQLAHHVTFLCVTIVLARRSAMGYSGLVAMAMEGSSPALNAMNICRTLDGPLAESATLGLFVLFAVLFVLLRCLLFGKAVLRVAFLRFFAPEGFPMHVPGWEIDAVVLLWMAGWMLQLHWCRLIFLKVKRKLFRPKKE